MKMIGQQKMQANVRYLGGDARLFLSGFSVNVP
jgi:hypothetical protein